MTNNIKLDNNNIKLIRKVKNCLDYNANNILLFKRLKLNYSSAKLNSTSPTRDSKIFYNQTISESPLNMDSEIPPIEYKNGLIHDAMDDEEQNLKWRVEP